MVFLRQKQISHGQRHLGSPMGPCVANSLHFHSHPLLIAPVTLTESTFSDEQVLDSLASLTALFHGLPAME